jgi:hypothetical protein
MPIFQPDSRFNTSTRAMRVKPRESRGTCSRRSQRPFAVIFSLAFSWLAVPSIAHADSATVSVGDPDRFSQPPPNAPIVVVRDDRGDRDHETYENPPDPSHDIYRSPFRLNVGPIGVTSGRGLGLGVGVAADFGTGTVGARIAGAWARGENSSDSNAQQSSSNGDLGTGLGQYTGELTLDFNKHGRVHPIFGVGLGLAHIQNEAGGGNAGIGIARLGVEYSLGLEDADVRLGGGVTGVLAGPEDKEVENLRGYALIGAQIAIGF